MSYEDIDKLTEARASTLAFTETDSQRILFPVDPAPSMDFPGFNPQRLEHLKKKEIRYTLHGSTLSQYWRNKRIPRGLRIHKEPTIGRNNENFCKRWCDILNKCSLDLMLLVIEHVNDELSKTCSEITELQTEMATKYDAQQLQNIQDQCSALIEGYKKELLEIKLRKYRRDTLDYKNGQVYRWLSTPRRRFQPTAISETEPSSGLSTDESGTEGASAGNAPHHFLSTRGRATHRLKVRNVGQHAEVANDIRHIRPRPQPRPKYRM